MMILDIAKFIYDVLLPLSRTNSSVEYRIAGDTNHTGAFLNILTPDALIRVTVFGNGSHEITAVNSQTGVEFFRKVLGSISQKGAAETALENIEKVNGLIEMS